ncbi:MAG TPA: ribosome-associated translation inhibitor RaiA [Phycisphaerales bacterium]|nr:ribosome-associated translation inhibitor RaiA [Phycisphaerales bacterium]HMP38205.1 ribosome-associated translation inhibitor RaiA [Phycisphaerales bacterium]
MRGYPERGAGPYLPHRIPQSSTAANAGANLMQINLSAKHMTLTPAIEEYARKKVEKLPRYFDRIQAVEVVVSKEKSGYHVEIRTDVEHHDDFIATSLNEDLYACIDLTVDRSIRQLTDHKSRIRNHHNGHTERQP